MEYQLRIYEVKPGERETFIEDWREVIVPLREEAGFEVVGAWREGVNGFIWILGYDGDFEAADAMYYTADARTTMTHDPAVRLAKVETKQLTPVD
jgi:hypothetical protein